jgi:uncharacterized membrane protein AbrB (regulator of aidB expression)
MLDVTIAVMCKVLVTRAKPMNWTNFFLVSFLFFVALLLLGLERGDKVQEAILKLFGSTPIMAIAVVYVSIWFYAGCVMLKVCPTVQALGWR